MREITRRPPFIDVSLEELEGSSRTASRTTKDNRALSDRLQKIRTFAGYDGEEDYDLGEWMSRAAIDLVFEQTTALDESINKTYKVVVTEGPRLVLSPTLLSATGKGTPIKIRSVCLFTQTSKMAALSFSLPAGPISVGGSCPSSKAPIGQEHDWICNGCYAAGGSYGNLQPQAAQQARYEWVKRSLAVGGPEGLATQLVDGLALAISCVEKARARKNSWAMKIDPRFFRIHDSGDFYSEEYWQAWVLVAQALPKVHFWAPTRQHRTVAGRRWFERTPPPPNMAVRPSALRVDEPPPRVAGMAAGTSVGWPLHGSRLPDDGGEPPHGYVRSKSRRPAFVAVEGPSGEWFCPVYRDDAKSCRDAKCRTCWVAPDEPVMYKAHGNIKKIKKVRKNPFDVPQLADLFEEWRSTPRVRSSGQPVGTKLRDEFEGWVAAQSWAASDFEVDEWIEVARAAGFSPEEECDYIESLGEFW